MSVVFARDWSALALRGGVLILLGIVALAHPLESLYGFVLTFGALSLAGGIVMVVASVTALRGRRRWRVFLIDGLIGLLIGLVALALPAMTMLAALILVAAWAVAGGLWEVGAASLMRGKARGWWLMLLTGAVSVLFGLLMVSWPTAGVLFITWLLGGYAVLRGIVLVGVALGLRKLSLTVGKDVGAVV